MIQLTLGAIVICNYTLFADDLDVFYSRDVVPSNPEQKSHANSLGFHRISGHISSSANAAEFIYTGRYLELKEFRRVYVSTVIPNVPVGWAIPIGERLFRVEGGSVEGIEFRRCERSYELPKLEKSNVTICESGTCHLGDHFLININNVSVKEELHGGRITVIKKGNRNATPVEFEFVKVGDTVRFEKYYFEVTALRMSDVNKKIVGWATLKFGVD